MDSANEERATIHDLTSCKRQSAPIIMSLCKIIGYKIGQLEVVIKTMDVFNAFITENFYGLAARSAGKASNTNARVKKSVSFSDIIAVETTDDRRDLNLNAKEGRSETNVTNLRKVVTKSKRSHRRGTSITKGLCRMQSKGSPTPGRKSRALKTNTVSDNASTASLLRKMETRSATNLQTAALKLNDTPAVSSVKNIANFKKRGRPPRNEIRAIKKSDGASTSKASKMEKVLSANSQMKTRQSNSFQRKRNRKRCLDKPLESPKSPGEKCGVLPLDKSTRTGRQAAVEKSSDKTSIKYTRGSRRWADVVAGYSKSETRMKHLRDDDIQLQDVDVGEGNQTSAQNTTLVNKKTHSKRNSSRSSRSRTVKCIDGAGTSQKKIHRNMEKPGKLTSVVASNNNYPDNFPSLEEQKGRKYKREKWCRQQFEENRLGNWKIVSKRRKRLLRRYANLPILSRSKSQRKDKGTKRGKNRGKPTLVKKDPPNGKTLQVKEDQPVSETRQVIKKDQSKGETSQVTTAEESCNDYWYIFDDMREVVIQPVGNVCPLHEVHIRTDPKFNHDGPSSEVAVLAIDLPQRNDDQNTSMDICSQMNAMSVDEGTSCTIAQISKGNKRITNGSPSRSNKYQRSKRQNDVGKHSTDEPGPSQKKISTKYRALLRRDIGKVDAKTATAIFNCGRWVDNHQREKVYDRFDSHQQRRNQIGSITNDLSYQEDTNGSAEGEPRPIYLNDCPILLHATNSCHY